MPSSDPRTPSPYRLPVTALVQLSLSICFGRPRRSLGSDAMWLVATRQPRPLLTGLDLLGTSGALLVANHYQRPGLWIGWAGALIAAALYARQPAVDPPLRILVTNTQYVTWRGKQHAVPFSRWFLRRVAALWGLIPLPAAPADMQGRGLALRMSLRCLKAREVVLLFPEGEAGSAAELSDALPGTGTFVALASRHAPILPVAFWEEGATLRGQVGPPITEQLAALDGHDAAIRHAVMAAIGALLPRSAQGTTRGNCESR